jgi:hypothetical protein
MDRDDLARSFSGAPLRIILQDGERIFRNFHLTVPNSSRRLPPVNIAELNKILEVFAFWHLEAGGQ